MTELAEWLTPWQAVMIIVPRLSNNDERRAIELILDCASEGSIRAHAGRLAVATRTESVVKNDVELSANMWGWVKRDATYACWETGDFDVVTHVPETGWLHATFRAVRLFLADVEALVPPTGGACERSTVRPGIPRAPWPETRMKEAIAVCSITNRDAAWRDYFKSKSDEHGWGVEAFRSIWSEARGSKGRTGRPPRSN